MKPFKKHRYYFEFYTTFKYEIALLPHIAFHYKDFRINVISLKWLWFGFYLQIFK